MEVFEHRLALDHTAPVVLELKARHSGVVTHSDARVIGEVANKPKGMVLLRTAIGAERIIDLPTGEDLPRIC